MPRRLLLIFSNRQRSNHQIEMTIQGAGETQPLFNSWATITTFDDHGDVAHVLRVDAVGLHYKNGYNWDGGADLRSLDRQ